MLTRRKFFGRLGLFLSGSLFGGTAKNALAQPVDPNSTPPPMPADKAASIVDGSIAKHYDLIVVGGGISGVSAAISAARHGLNVALVHNRSMFGGNSSSEVKLFPENNSNQKPWIKEGGIHEEFHTEERVRNHEEYREGRMNCHWDLVLYEWVIREKNITPYLNTHMHRVFMKNDSAIESIFAIQLGTEKSFTLSAPLFVDSSGDGILGGLAKAEHRWGREAASEYNEPLAPKNADEKVMGNTIMFTAVDTGKPAPFKRPDWVAEFKSDEELTSRSHSDIKGGYWWTEVGAPYHPIKDNNETAHEGLRQVLGVWDHIKNRQCSKVDKEKAANYGLDFIGFWPYKRESRRIIGEHVLTQHDVQNPKPLDDAVAYGAWNIDVHVQGGIFARDMEPFPSPHRHANWQDIGTVVYPIPIRSLYSKNVNNLMMAGRPISASYLAFASTRVLSTGSICGEAVGIIAALAKKHGATPREIAKSHAAEAQQIILRADGHIPGVENNDPNDLARKAKVAADSQAKMVFPEHTGSRELDIPHAQLFPVTSDRIDKVELHLRSELKNPATLRVGLREAGHVWDFRSEKDIASAEATVPAGSEGWIDFDLKASVTPGKLYYIHTSKLPGVRIGSYRDESGSPIQVPVGTTPADLPDKSPFMEKSKTFRQIFANQQLSETPGAGKHGHWSPINGGRSLGVRVFPDNMPYGPENVIKGTNRPDMWSNIWISDPAKPLPASLELAWDSPVEFNTVQLTFDTDQNRRITLPFFRYPDCVKDYTLEYNDGTGWKPLADIKENYVRRRVHQFEKVRGKKLRITATATNGAPSARIYEVRVYNDKLPPTRPRVT